MCPQEDATRDASLMIYDLFSQLDISEMVPEVAKTLKSVVACGVVGNVWNANLTYYAIPGMQGPCGSNAYQGLGDIDTCTGWTFTNNPYGDEYVFWQNYIRTYAPTSSTPSRGPGCYEYNHKYWGNWNGAWGGQPYCSFYTDLSPMMPSCAETARFRRRAVNDYQYETEEEGETYYDAPSVAPAFEEPYPDREVSGKDDSEVSGEDDRWVWDAWGFKQRFNYTHEYCTQPNTVKNPFYMNVYELVTCDSWQECTGAYDPKFGFKDYWNNGTFPVCNPCNCAGGGQGAGSGGKRDGGCGGQGAGSGGKRDGGCGGQGAGSGGKREVSSVGVGSETKFEFDVFAEMLELMTQLNVVNALQESDPWNEILGRMCSCACGPSF